jgi:membrane protein
VVPDEDAIALTDEARARQGIPREEQIKAKARQRSAGLPVSKRVDSLGTISAQVKKLQNQRYIAAVVGFLVALVMGALRGGLLAGGPDFGPPL